MKITILTYLEKEGDEKLDVVVDQVAEALRRERPQAVDPRRPRRRAKLISGIAPRASPTSSST